MKAIIDLTSTQPGSEERAVEAVINYESAAGGAQYEALAHPAQMGAFASLAATRGVRVRTIPAELDPPELIAEISAPISDALWRGETVRVYSYSYAVKGVTEAWQARYEGCVWYAPLAPLTRSAPAARWDGTFMSEEDAVEALVRAIGASGEQDQVDLRPLLQRLDQRFDKRSGGFATSPGFISRVVGLGVKQGLVFTVGEHPRVTVKLTEAGHKLVEAAPPRDVEDLAEPAASPPDRRGGPQIGPGESVRQQSRSDRFVTALRQAHLGPFMDVRTKVYEEIDHALESGPKPLRSLVRNAVKAVRESDPSRDLPWSRVTQFVEQLMVRRPVALSGEELVAPGWSTGTRQINGMVAQWHLLLDGELVLQLVDAGHEIRWEDLPELAGALYAGRSETLIERVFNVVQNLADEGVVELAGVNAPIRRSVEQNARDAGSGSATVVSIDALQRTDSTATDPARRNGAPDGQSARGSDRHLQSGEGGQQ